MTNNTKTLRCFIGDLGADTPAPGGGCASAVAISEAAALAAMVAGITTRRKVLPEACRKPMEELARRLRRDSLKLLTLADADTASFLKVAKVAKTMKHAKSKAGARAAMNRALVGAMMPPCRAIAVGTAIAAQLDDLGRLMSSRMRSDLAVCALLLQAGVRGCLLNVLANVSGMSEDSVPREKVAEALASDREVSRTCARISRGQENGLRAECGGSRLKRH